MDQHKEIYQEIQWEDAGIWFISDEYGFKILAKFPSNVIRSLLNGCRMEFLFGKDNQGAKTFFHTGARIFDDNNRPCIITQPSRFKREYTGLERILKEEEVIIEFFDELVTCSATAELKIAKEDRISNLHFINDMSKFYIGDFTESLNLSLDSFVYSIDSSLKTANSYKIDVRNIPCEIKNWKIINKSFIGFSDVQKVNISDKNEGGVFEKQIWFSIESIFSSDAYLNPIVHQDTKSRELTDILAFYKYGIFLIETKALGVLNIDKGQSMERKVANIKKQIKTGIKQLVGAHKNIKRNLPIFSNSGMPVNLDNSLIAHCIVLVSELLPFGDWKDVEQDILLAMLNERIYIHVMDFQEFIRYVKVSDGKKERFDYFLMQRVEQFVQEGGKVQMKTKFIME
jgi:hypothetical protein